MEKILRLLYIDRVKDKLYIPVDTATLGQLLTENNAEIVKVFGRVDILVNNAGLTRDNLFMRMSDEDWQLVLDVNLSAGFKLAKAAIRGMRNPMNSWCMSDSYCTYVEDAETHETAKHEFFVGDNDLVLMKSLSKAGSDHAKFLRMINVTLDITAPLYFLKEWDTYKVATVSNSCSTMHKIHVKEFTLDDFSHEQLSCEVRDILEIQVIPTLNMSRDYFVKYKDKQYWWDMIQLLPSSYNQKRTVQLNYQVLKSMYHARNNHKLDEWRTLCEWIESLPYSELITG